MLVNFVVGHIHEIKNSITYISPYEPIDSTSAAVKHYLNTTMTVLYLTHGVISNELTILMCDILMSNFTLSQVTKT
jgi:hypothetical protein